MDKKTNALSTVLSTFIVIIVLMCFLSITACKKNAPKCSDPETVEKVTESIKSKLLDVGLSKEDVSSMKISLDAIRTTDINDKTGKQECACIVKIKDNKDIYELSTTYSSELLDNKDEGFVEITEFSGAGLINIANKKMKKKVQLEKLRTMVLSIQSIGVNYYREHSVLPFPNDLRSMWRKSKNHKRGLICSMYKDKLYLKVYAPKAYNELHEFDGQEIILTPVIAGNKGIITGWEHSGELVQNYDLNW